MGLDMYLKKVTYVGYELREKLSIPKLGIKKGRIQEVKEVVIYWRKCNSIHNWFVANVQGGKDECQESEVSLEQAKELLKVITDILDCKSDETRTAKARECLEPVGGFFFGSTEMDSWYWDDLKRTKKELTSVIKEMEDDKTHSSWLIYQASW